ncbi:hypothetical protein [Solitalea koreensis]|uniref:Outer membrane protein beta-barrel domain-containing protein n=1 Tax=Solitalea koreensis TaxID=543615 RepID=A0A521BKI6_9SPHI|nr:hypothetical protein [Solitalea koreensis]SMO47678.1 hypothetical protein SAMN06265350_102279 [Solitalea koreensis]
MKKLFVIIIAVFSSLSSLAQEDSTLVNEDKPPRESKIFYGGNIGLQFGTYTFIDLSPMVGYKVVPHLGIGVGITYQYLSNRGYGYSNYGARTFANYNVWKPIILQAEYEYLSVQSSAFANKVTVSSRRALNNVYLGGGLRQRVGPRSALDILLLYNVNEVSNSPYQNPLLRVGFVVGL